jgi:hypothetical protein
MGFAKAFGFSNLTRISSPISKKRNRLVDSVPVARHFSDRIPIKIRMVAGSCHYSHCHFRWSFSPVGKIQSLGQFLT